MTTWYRYDMATVTCQKCGQVLGRVDAGKYVTKRHGRETVVSNADAVVSVQCERCQHVTRRANVKRHGATEVERR